MPSLQLQEHRKRVVRPLPIMYTKSRSNNRLTRNPQPPPTKPDLVTLRSFVLLIIFSLTVLIRCCSWETASCAYLPCSSSQECLFLHCNFLTPCRNEVLAALRPIPMPGAKKATDSTALALRRPVKVLVKPLAGYIGLEKRKPFAPPFVK